MALSPVTSIEKEKIKLEKEKINDEAKEALSADINRQIAQANEIASEQAARSIDTARIAREAQRQVDEALRTAQREIQQAHWKFNSNNASECVSRFASKSIEVVV